MGMFQNYTWEALTRKKPLEKSLAEEQSEKTLRWYDLTAYGIAATVGSGIYVICGQVAREHTGPAVIFSVLIAGLLSLLTGLCYLEFAAALPISGSGYAYAYTVLGEFIGWFIGWNLTLEYAFAAAAIAGGWTKYLVQLFAHFNIVLPTWLYAIATPYSLVRFNLIAGLVMLAVGCTVARGLKFGATFTNIITLLNIGIILFIIIVGACFVDPTNWSPIMPLGVKGLFSGAGQMFFAFIGFDTVSTLAADAINPSRDVPLAVLLTAGTATTLYMAAGWVLTGMQNYAAIDPNSPLMTAFTAVGANWAAVVVSLCSISTMLATMMACMIGQPKIFQAIARDGLLPRILAVENSRHAPVFSVLATTILTAVMAATIDVTNGLIDFISFGALFGLSAICAGLMITRFQGHEDLGVLGPLATVVFFVGTLTTSFLYEAYGLSWITLTSAGILLLLPFAALCYMFLTKGSQLQSKSLSFKCPLMPVLPCMAIFANMFVMSNLTAVSFIQFAIWTAIGLLIYFAYGIHHSQLGVELMGEKTYGTY